MPKKPKQQTSPTPTPRPSALLDARVVYCPHNLDQLAKLPDRSVDLIYIDPPFNSNRNYEVFWAKQRKFQTPAVPETCLIQTPARTNLS